MMNNSSLPEILKKRVVVLESRRKANCTLKVLDEAVIVVGMYLNPKMQTKQKIDRKPRPNKVEEKHNTSSRQIFLSYSCCCFIIPPEIYCCRKID